MALTFHVSQEALDRERIRQYLCELRFWTLLETEQELGLKRHGILHEFHLARQLKIITVHVPADSSLAVLWDRIYSYTQRTKYDFIDPREPLTDEEWERIEALKEEHLDRDLVVTADAALHLGISTTTFTKLRRAHRLEPDEKFYTSAGYIAHKYLLRHVEALREFVRSRPRP